VYFNVNFNVFFKLIKVYFLVSELYIHQNARCKDTRKLKFMICDTYEILFGYLNQGERGRSDTWH